MPGPQPCGAGHFRFHRREQDHAALSHPGHEEDRKDHRPGGHCIRQAHRRTPASRVEVARGPGSHRRYYRTSAAITKITADTVEAAGGSCTPSALSIIIPPLAGVAAVAGSPGLANPKGFVPVDAHYRHQTADGVYAVGVAVAFPPVEETAVPVNFPKTGHMTQQMAQVTARDIAARLAGREAPSAELSARCVLDLGDRGAYLAVDPVRPPRNTIPTVSEGRRWLLAKRAFERAYLWHARHGRPMPTTFGW